MTAQADRYLEVVEADDTNPNAITKPPGRWRNWYRTLVNGAVRVDTMEFYPIGSVIQGAFVWPSKDVAESKAEGALGLGIVTEYLGAFPEGEAPPE